MRRGNAQREQQHRKLVRFCLRGTQPLQVTIVLLLVGNTIMMHRLSKRHCTASHDAMAGVDINAGSSAVMRHSQDGSKSLRPLRVGSEPAQDCASSSMRKKRLEFIHITKTGGSAIERAAIPAGIMWGTCKFISVNELGCDSPDYEPDKPPPTVFQVSAPWHLPMQYFAHNPYGGETTSTFTIVRDPYDRVVSEYYCPWSGHKNKNNDRDDPVVMNKWIQEKILGQRWSQNPHYMPQHYYVYNQDGKQIIDHVLFYESLEEDFAKLMKMYCLNITLQSKVSDPTNMAVDRRLSRNDLTSETIALINEHYAEDFVRFEYPLVSVS